MTRTSGTSDFPMTTEDPLRIRYTHHEQVHELIDVVTYCVEAVSMSFDGWDDDRVRGPGLYIAVVSGDSVAPYADPMGANRWPVESYPAVTRELDPFFEAASEVALERDGAVVISVDGAVLEQMVRFRDLTPGELAALEDVYRADYADWIGARHMSAADTSVRPDVVTTITLSEEDGRVTLFENGRFQDYSRDHLGAPWRTPPRETTDHPLD